MGIITSTIAALIGAATIGAGATALAAKKQKPLTSAQERQGVTGKTAEQLEAESKEEARLSGIKKRKTRARTGGTTLLADGGLADTLAEPKTLLGG